MKKKQKIHFKKKKIKNRIKKDIRKNKKYYFNIAPLSAEETDCL